MKLLALFFLGICLVSSHSTKVTFNESKVFRIIPKNEGEIQLLKGLEDNHMEYDFWKSPLKPNIPVDIMVVDKNNKEFHELMKINMLEYEVYIDDVQSLIDRNVAKFQTYSKKRFDWLSYQTLESTYEWMNSMAEQHPDIITVLNAGKSYEDRDIIGVKISFNEGRSAVFIESGTHAREWITPATATYFINELITSTDPQLRKIAESFDWYIFPVTNPDGFEYSFTTNRLWRKTRTPYGACTGADPNRNWDFLWGGPGSSSNPCTQTYSGSHVFSEKETKAISDFVISIAENQKIDVFLCLHSYSQLLLIPFGNTTEPLANYHDAVAIGEKAIEALAVKYGTEYIVGNGAEVLYVTSGTARDWAKDKMEIPLVYTYEFRDKGQNGFILPPEEIISNSEEFLDSIIGMFTEAENLGYFDLVDLEN